MRRIYFLLIFCSFLQGCVKEKMTKTLEFSKIILAKSIENNLNFDIEGIVSEDTIIFAIPTKVVKGNFSLIIECEGCEEMYLNSAKNVGELLLNASEKNSLYIKYRGKIKQYLIVVKNVNSSLNVLILGNSVTKTIPIPTIGWYGNWGMAASEREKDYVHLLKSRIDNYSDSIDMRVFSISWFERKYWDETEKGNIGSFINIKPDILIINIGENIDDELVIKNNFKSHFSNFIDTIIDKETKILLVNSFWFKENFNKTLKNISLDFGYQYIDISELEKNPVNMAFEYYINKGVGSHPSNLGMKEIADKIFPVFVIASFQN